MKPLKPIVPIWELAAAIPCSKGPAPSERPPIPNASPERGAGGGLSWLRTGDTIRIDLNAGTCHALVEDAEIARRKTEPAPPIPESQTPWEELYREKTSQLSTGGVLEFAVKYRGTSATVPRHNH